MPKSLEELIHIGVEKYGFVASRITTKEGVRIDNIRDIKDGDIVILEWFNFRFDKYGFSATEVTVMGIVKE